MRTVVGCVGCLDLNVVEIQMQFARTAENLPLRRIVWSAASVVLALVIFYFTILKHQQSAPLGPWTDKIYHFVAFAILVMPTAIIYKRALFWVVPAALLFGAAIEIIQPYVGRQGEFADFFGDALGVLFGAAAGLLIRVGLFARLRSGQSEIE